MNYNHYIDNFFMDWTCINFEYKYTEFSKYMNNVTQWKLSCRVSNSRAYNISLW